MTAGELQKTRERKRAWQAKYRAADIERSRDQLRKWRASNGEAVRTRSREYQRKIRAENPERVNKKKRERRAENPAKVREEMRRWCEKNPESVRAIAQRRRASMKTSTANAPTAEQLKDLLKKPCHYCGGPAEHIDHYIPLARGGTHTLDNLRSACAPCNLSKGAKLPSEWEGR